MRTWIIIKKIEAANFSSALKKEKQSEIIQVREVVPEKDQMVSAIGFDGTVPVEDEEDYEE